MINQGIFSIITLCDTPPSRPCAHIGREFEKRVKNTCKKFKIKISLGWVKILNCRKSRLYYYKVAGLMHELLLLSGLYITRKCRTDVKTHAAVKQKKLLFRLK